MEVGGRVSTPEAGAAQKEKKGTANNKRYCFPEEKHTQMDGDSHPPLFFQGVCVCVWDEHLHAQMDQRQTSARKNRADEQNVYTHAAAAADAHSCTVVIKT